MWHLSSGTLEGIFISFPQAHSAGFCLQHLNRCILIILSYPKYIFRIGSHQHWSTYNLLRWVHCLFNSRKLSV